MTRHGDTMARKLLHVLGAYRWPFLLGGLLGMSILAQGVLVYVATRPGAPRPMARYYQRSLNWDADASVLALSRSLGYAVRVAIPRGPEYDMAELRPLDISVHASDGTAVTGLTGSVVMMRPADTRLDNMGDLIALPQAPGNYRALVRLPVAGVWEFALDTRVAGSRFVHTDRVVVSRESRP
jgi:hypothetical protein